MSKGLADGGNKSTSNKTIQLKALKSGVTMDLVVPTPTTVWEVREMIAKMTEVDVGRISISTKMGAYYRRQFDGMACNNKSIVLGIENFKTARFRWPHPTAIIGAGYHGMKTAMTYLMQGDKDITVFDRHGRVGGFCWLKGANKTSRLQSEFGSFHLWWGPEALAKRKCGGYPDCNDDGVGWSIWPDKAEVLKMFQQVAEEFGILPHIKFNCEVNAVEATGTPPFFANAKTEERVYSVRFDVFENEKEDADGKDAGGGEESRTPISNAQLFHSCIFHFPGNLTKERVVNFPGQDTFGGAICYGMKDAMPYDKLPDASVAILGNGAFAAENARTCIECKAKKVYIVTRRKNLSCPRIVSWFVHQAPLPTPGSMVLDFMAPMYEATNCGDPWKYESVVCEGDNASTQIKQGSRFGISDVTFLMHAWGLLEYVESEVKRISAKALHMENGNVIEGVNVIVKAFGMVGDPAVDQLHYSSEMIGPFAGGDWRRAILTDAIGVDGHEFTAFSTGLHTTRFALSHKHLFDFPKDFYKMRDEGLMNELPVTKAVDPQPAYCVDIRTFTTAQLILSSMCPSLQELQGEFGFEKYKHTMYHCAHGTRRVLEAALAEWDEYQDQWKNRGHKHDYVPYPYTLDKMGEWFAEYSRVVGKPISIDGPAEVKDLRLKKLDNKSAAAPKAAAKEKKPAEKRTGEPLKILMRNEEKNFSYEGLPSWVPEAAAIQKLFRTGEPFLPADEPPLPRLSLMKTPPPFKRLPPKKLAEAFKINSPGDIYGLPFPQTAAQMTSADFGADWFTKAFHAAGTLPKDNKVTKLIRAQELSIDGYQKDGGSAMKCRITVEYEKPSPELHTELFAKYTYDPAREIAGQMAIGQDDYAEVQINAVGVHLFPHRSPQYYYGDICRENTAYLIITESIPYGAHDGRDFKPYEILPGCGKCQDYLLESPAEMYFAIFRSMGRMAAWDKLGRFDSFLGAGMAWTRDQYLVSNKPPVLSKDNIGMTKSVVGGVIDKTIDFFTRWCVKMAPPQLQDQQALTRAKAELLEMSPWFKDMSGSFQMNDSNFTAAVHQNLQADNAWFWRDEYNDISCGILDFGGFGRSQFCVRWLGCLSGADTETLLAHEEGIIKCFVDEYYRCGGPSIDLDETVLRWRLALITYCYDCYTYVERSVYKETPFEEFTKFTGPLDPAFQERFYTRCASLPTINTWNFYITRGNFKAIFDEWARGAGKPYMTRYQ